MKQVTVSILEDDYSALFAALTEGTDNERAAFAYGGISITENEVRVTIRSFEVIPDELVQATPVSMQIPASVYIRKLLRAKDHGPVAIFIHSHPADADQFSVYDDETDEALFHTAHMRLDSPVHLSMLITRDGKVNARAWFPGCKKQDVSRVRIIGKRFQFLDRGSSPQASPSVVQDRVERAFGGDLPRVLSRLHVGIVGLGGTGSAVCQQLARLGVGRLTLVDPETLDLTNVSRVYASGTPDHGIKKVDIAASAIRSMGLGTNLRLFPESTGNRAVCEALRSCDVIFGCTDDNYGRSLLNKLSLFYLIPLIDMAVQIIPGEAGVEILGRVSTLLPGTPCLICRKRITGAQIVSESRAFANPEEAQALRREGYLLGADAPAPSVVTFTTLTASHAVQEFINRLVGYMEPATELYLQFNERRERRQGVTADPACFCVKRKDWGRGDQPRFLGIQW